MKDDLSLSRKIHQAWNGPASPPCKYYDATAWLPIVFCSGLSYISAVKTLWLTHPDWNLGERKYEETQNIDCRGQ
jgi:hypothetical protein